MREKTKTIIASILRAVKAKTIPETGWAMMKDVRMEICREFKLSTSRFYGIVEDLHAWGYIEKSRSPVAKISIIRITPYGEEFLASLSTSPEGKGDAPISTPQVQTAPVSKPSGAHSPSSTSPEGEPAEPPSPPATAPPSHGGGDEAGNATKEVDSHA